MKKIITLLCVILTMNACEADKDTPPCCSEPPTRLFRSYINTFVKCDSLYVTYSVGIPISETDKSIDMYNPIWNSIWADTVPQTVFSVIDGVSVCAKGFAKERSGYYYDVPEIGSTGFLFSDGTDPNDPFYFERKAGFDKYVALIGDTVFNKKLVSTAARAMIDTLSSIVITADKDFGNSFPAGSSLNDLFTLYFQDPYSFVKNGYKPIEDTYNNNFHPSVDVNARYYLSYFKAELSKFNFAERPFLGDEWYFCLDVAPEQTNEYTFYIKFVFVNGTEVEGTAPPINIKGSNE